MGSSTTPLGYYDRYDREIKKWKKILFNPGRALQSSELNEMQSIIQDEHAQVAKTVFEEGAIVSGLLFSINLDTYTLSVSAGKLYAGGFIHDIAETTVPITGIGTETIGILITPQVITEVQDPSLNDPAIGTENYGWSGSHRLTYTYELTVNDPTAVTIGILEDGQLVAYYTQARPIYSKILNLLANRTFDESGSYTVFPFKLKTYRLDSAFESDYYDYKLRLKIDGGRAYVRGWKVENSVFTKVFDRTVKPLVPTDVNAPDTILQEDEAQAVSNTHNGIPLVYQLFNYPIDNVSIVSAKVQTGYYARSRSNNDTDTLLNPNLYPLMTSVFTIDEVFKYVSGNSGPTVTYTQGVDYTRSGYSINWNTGGGIEPSVGETYYVKVTYQRQMVKGKRVLTYVASEAVTKGTDLSTEILNSGNGRECKEIVKIFLDENTTYTDYSVTLHNGHITWTGNNKPVDGTTYYVQYWYWNHTVEGDYVSRDSFVDSNNKPLLYSTPAKTAINARTIDYSSQITFETTSGVVPKVGTDILFTYEFVIPRIDLVNVDKNGVFRVIRGIPSINPVVPVGSNECLPIASIHLPPEATPETIRIVYFDNKTLTMPELRALLRTVKNMNYNDAMFQLHQGIMNKPLPTDKLGIIADNFNSHLLSDGGNENYATTLDYLSGHCMLPQTTELVALTPKDTSTAKYVDNYYVLPYTHSLYIQQVYATESVFINEYDAAYITSRVHTYPIVDTWTEHQTIRTETIVESTAPAETFDLVVRNSLRGATSPIRFSGTLEFFRALFANGWNSSPTIPATNSPLRRMQPESWWTEFTNATSGRAAAPAGATLGRVTVTGGMQSTTLYDPGWTNIISNQVTTLLPVARQVPIFAIGEEFIPNTPVTCYFDGVKVDMTDSGYSGAQYRLPYESELPSNTPFDVPLPTVIGPVPINTDGHVTLAKPTAITSVANEDGTITVGANGKWFGVLEVPPNTNAGTHEIIFVGLGNDVQSSPIVATEFTSTGYLSTVYEDVTIQPPSRTIARTVDLTIDQTLIPITFGGGGGGGRDPLAQTFITKESCFITKIDLFFHIKPTKSIIVEIREVLIGMPTRKILGTTTLGPEDCVDSSNGTLATTFMFNAPVFVEADKEYAFVVITADTQAKLWVARLNGTDPVNGWVNTNPYTGVLLKSSNASTWSAVQNMDIKFNIHRAEFDTTAAIYFDDVTFNYARSRFEYSNQCIEPGNYTHVRYQCSIDGVTWKDFTPPIETDMGTLSSTLKTRILLLGGGRLSPVVYNNFSVAGHSWESSGKYVVRMFKLAKDDVAGSLDVWLDTYVPSGTTLTVKVCYDGTLTNYVTVPYVVGDDVRINERGWYEKHYSVNAGIGGLALSGGHFPLVDTYTSLHILVEMTTNNLAVTPQIASFRASANDLP